MTYIENSDENVRTFDSPLDPWGLLTAEEKAQAATIHARLVRTPRTPFVLPPPLTDQQRREEAMLQCTRGGVTYCVFGCQNNDISHYVSGLHRAAGNQYLWGPVCTNCVASIQGQDRSRYYVITPFTSDECPNWHMSGGGYPELRAWHVGFRTLMATAHPEYEGEFTLRFVRNGRIILREAQYASLRETRQRARRLQRVLTFDANGVVTVTQRAAENALLSAF